MIKDLSNLGSYNYLDFENEMEGEFKNVKKYTADFETAVWLEDETWVWAWAVCDIETEEIKIGTEIDEFINFCKGEKNCQVYLHNLKFDR